MKTAAGLVALAILVQGQAVPAAAPPHIPAGLWMSPHRNVIVRTGPCGDKLCGWIAWANEEAKADARDGGTTRLVGTELLEDYHPQSDKTWAGTVFVPDMGRRFSSRIIEISPRQLRVKGCLLGGFICKSQVWNRVERLPDA
jgi:uncharacterized protein (DUF2147 family)